MGGFFYILENIIEFWIVRVELQEAKVVFQNAVDANKNNKIDDAIELYSKIKNSCSELNEIYAYAQFNLGLLLNNQNRIQEAKIAYKNVKREDHAETYAKAQFNLGLLLKNQNYIEEAEVAYKNVKRGDRNETYAKAQLNLGVLLKNQMRIDEAEVAFRNIKREDLNETYAKAQLSLGFLLKNQFRLYGKQDQKEGSGLSLILSNLFFEQENSFSNIRLQNKSNLISESIDVTEDDDVANDPEENAENEIVDEKVIQKLPLYRCIYIDPDSKLIEISHREEWTFCREAKSSKSDKWDNYSNDIQKLRDVIKREFLNLENLIQPLYQKISEDIKKYSNEAQLLAEILLPLRFLIKHMAFKEEQECRIVYVSQWDDEFIQFDASLKRFYVDYGHDVATHLKKIYLGPHAVHEKSMFEYLCSHAKKDNRTEHEVKIKISHNPLR